MLIIRGPLAFSHFRIERWLTQINYLVPQVNSLSAEFIHFIDLETPLTKLENQTLSNLLHYASYSSEPTQEAFEEKMLLVIPKAEITSSWSQRAINIIHQCDLQQVRQIERGIIYTIQAGERLTWGDEQAIAALLHDPLTETVFYSLKEAERLFKKGRFAQLSSFKEEIQWVDVLNEGRVALIRTGRKLGLNFLEDELNYLLEICDIFGRNLTDIELVTIIEFYSTSRYRTIFNTKWQIDNVPKTESLLSMLKNTQQLNPRGILSVYNDITAVTESGKMGCFFIEPSTQIYQYHLEAIANVVTTLPCNFDLNAGIVAEVQNEIAVGRGAKSRAAVCGYSVSNLFIPGFLQPWEIDYGGSKNIASPLEVILEAPIHNAQFNNEFGRPTLAGYFRTYEQLVPTSDMQQEIRGFHKPLLMAGGLGYIRQRHINRRPILPGMKIIILGGPVRSIEVNHDQVFSCNFILSQNENPEMHRRCQEVVNACTDFGFENPIIAIHAVGKGGIAAVLPSLIDDAKKGIYFELRDIPLASPALSALEIWRSEIEERYLLIIEELHLDIFQKIGTRGLSFCDYWSSNRYC